MPQQGGQVVNPQQNNLSLGQLRDMAMRQGNQIEAQQQMLVAKEQRLKYLRQQDFKQNQMAAEYERLRRLREKVRNSPAHCGMRDKCSMFLSALFKNLIFQCSF